jgi:8-oxo-dGTP pyrophosphatase MutT (NUDIX family)
MTGLSERVARRFLLGGKTSYGGFVVNDQGKVLLREPSNHFDGYHWTFAKGAADPGETPEEAALREVREETGVEAEIVGTLPGSFRGDPEEAQKMVSQSTNPIGQKRDLEILGAGWEAHSRMQGQHPEEGIRADHNSLWTEYLHKAWEDGKKMVPNPDWSPGDSDAHKDIQMIWRMKKDRSFSKEIGADFERFKHERKQSKVAAPVMMFGPGDGGDGDDGSSKKDKKKKKKKKPKKKAPPKAEEIPSSGTTSWSAPGKKVPKQTYLPGTGGGSKSYHSYGGKGWKPKPKKPSFLKLLIEAAKKNPALAEALKAELKDNQELYQAFHRELNPPKPKPRTSYGGVVFNSEGKILLRLPNPKMEPNSTWTFAKGGRDKGEMPADAAVREVYEETGVKAKIVGGVQGKFKGMGGDTHYYIMEPEDENAELGDFAKETEEIGWFTPEEAEKLISEGEHKLRRKRDLGVLAQALEHRAPDSSMETDHKNWEIFLDKFYQGGQRQVPRPSDYKTPGEQDSSAEGAGSESKKKTLSVNTLLKNHPPFRKALRAQFKQWLATKQAPQKHPEL